MFHSSTFLRSFLFLFLSTVSVPGLAQVTIIEQDFDADTVWDYSSNVTYFSHKGTNTLNNVYPAPDGWNDDGFYGVIDLSAANGLDYANLSGNVFGERDLDDEGDFGTSGDGITTFSTLDISAYNNVTLSFDYDIEGYNANSDEAFYQLYYNGFAEGRDTLQTGSTTGDNAEGTATVNVPDSVNTISLEVILNNNGASGYSGFDNFLLQGTPTSTIVEFTAPGAKVMEDAGSYNLDLEIHNPSGGSSTSADVALISGNATDLGGYSTQTVTFPSGSSANETVNVTISDDNTCDGDKSFLFELQNVSGGNTATSGYPHQFTLTVDDDEGVTSSSIAPTVCDSFTVPSGDTTYMSSGMYADTLVGGNAYGCDSIINIDLSVPGPNSSNLTVTACDSFTVPSGDTTHSSSGMYNDTLPNATASGCDSIINLDLTIANTNSSNVKVATCDSFTVPSGDTTYTSGGMYVDTLDNANAMGCDSIITFDLTIDTSTYASLSPTACNGYTVPSGDTTYSNGGMYSDTLKGMNAYGCDSIIEIDLTINTVNTMVSSNAPTLTSQATSASYQWIDCSDNSAIAGATSGSFTASSNGDYAVEVTQNGCTDTSSCYTINNVGIGARESSSAWSVRPNPTDGAFTVRFGERVQDLKVRILDLQGREVHAQEGFQGKELELELDRPDGIYFLQLISGERSELIKVVKE